MKQKNYFATMDAMFKQTNKKALLYGDGHAWDNKKKKTMRLQSPRGTVYKRFLAMNWKQMCTKLQTINENYSELLKDKVVS